MLTFLGENMIVGIGIDLIEIKRIEKAIKRRGFLERYFTEKEIEMFKSHLMNPQKIAGNFCAKEAIVKMFGTGFRNVKLSDLEVLRDESGKPTITLYSGAKSLGKSLGIESIHISITNTAEHATAVAIGERI